MLLKVCRALVEHVVWKLPGLARNAFGSEARHGITSGVSREACLNQACSASATQEVLDRSLVPLSVGQQHALGPGRLDLLAEEVGVVALVHVDPGLCYVVCCMMLCIVDDCCV